MSYNPSDEILVTVGGSEGIDIALRALVGPGDEVLIPEPSFVAYKGCTTFTGAKANVLELKAENDFKLTADELEEAITTRALVDLRLTEARQQLQAHEADKIVCTCTQSISSSLSLKKFNMRPLGSSYLSNATIMSSNG